MFGFFSLQTQGEHKYLNRNPLQLSVHTAFIGIDLVPLSVPTKEGFSGSSYSRETSSKAALARQKLFQKLNKISSDYIPTLF